MSGTDYQDPFEDFIYMDEGRYEELIEGDLDYPDHEFQAGSSY